VPHVLRVAALELGHPVAMLVEMESGDSPLREIGAHDDA
jgi:hypothetical protein